MRTSASRPLAIATITAGVVLFAASPSLAGADTVRSEGEIHRYGSSADFPDDATARVRAVYNAAGDTIVTLHVRGLNPNRTYGAHAHVNPCGLTGTAAGPHYQFSLDPAATPSAPSSNPVFANPVNEIWLDVTTNAAGNGVAMATQPWQFAPGKAPKSVIIHAEPTRTGAQGDTPAGSAGARLACVDVGF